MPPDAVPPASPDGERHRAAPEYGRAAFVSDGGRDQRRNAEQRERGQACHRVEQAGQDQPHGRRSHRDVPG
jgi:hypothetical protein